jgi:23S rRNA (cytosine1962-C5)-methyltransferase
MQIAVACAVGWDEREYALLDSGADFKLERFGALVLARPEPQAIWRRSGPEALWQSADATFAREAESAGEPERSSHWLARRSLPEQWSVRWRGLTLLARLTPFKHTGIFPEQSAHWEWLEQHIARAAGPVRVLNLFGYTGVASLVAARAGAQVTHVDASPKAIEWAHENQTASDLGAASIRWIADDALKFVRREARRGARYDLILLDPPAFGRGTKGEVWKFETSLPQLLAACRDVLAERPLGIAVTSYNLRASSLALAALLDDLGTDAGLHGTVTAGELAIAQRHTVPPRTLATAIFARWEPRP